MKSRPDKENSLQLDWWTGKEGDEYTHRNPRNTDEMREDYIEKYGMTRTEMNKEFLKDIPGNIKICEIGCNIGIQLDLLVQLGFSPSKMYGVEPNEEARFLLKLDQAEYNVIDGTSMDIPFKDNFFDLVMVSGVHIHLSKKNLTKSMQEIYRVSKQYIFIFEYWSKHREEIEYRGKTSLLWKDNYNMLYQKLFKLKLIKEEFYPFRGDKTKLSVMCLFEKT